MKGLKWSQDFPHYLLPWKPEFGSDFPPKTNAVNPLPFLMLQMKFDYDRPTGLWDVHVWKCGRTDGQTPARVQYYKLSLNLWLLWAKNIVLSITILCCLHATKSGFLVTTWQGSIFLWSLFDLGSRNCVIICYGKVFLKCIKWVRVNSANFGHQVNSDIHLQTLKIQMINEPSPQDFSLFAIFFLITIWNNVAVRI